MPGGLLPERRRRFASVEAAAIAGLVCAIGWSLALNGLLETPSITASAAEITAFFSSPDVGRSTLMQLQILVFATIAFLWFIGVVRSRLGDAEPKLFGTAFLGGAVLFSVILLVGGAALAAPAVLVRVGGVIPDPGAVSVSRATAVVLLSVVAPRIATLVIFSTATLGRTTGALPMWLVWLSYAVGVIEFINVTISAPTIYTFPAWIALVSIVLLIRRSTGDSIIRPA
jgi:hypothetical protein